MRNSILFVVLIVVLGMYSAKGPAINISGNTLQFGSFTQTK